MFYAVKENTTLFCRRHDIHAINWCASKLLIFFLYLYKLLFRHKTRMWEGPRNYFSVSNCDFFKVPSLISCNCCVRWGKIASRWCSDASVEITDYSRCGRTDSVRLPNQIKIFRTASTVMANVAHTQNSKLRAALSVCLFCDKSITQICKMHEQERSVCNTHCVSALPMKRVTVLWSHLVDVEGPLWRRYITTMQFEWNLVR